MFLAELPVIRELRTAYQVGVDLGQELRVQIQALVADRRARERALKEKDETSIDELEERLRASGFRRVLKEFQLENLRTINRLPHGADFSVPGAGKTTVALAGYSLRRAANEVEQLLVIAPIVAFSSWREDSAVCLDPLPRLAVHGGANSLIPESTEFLLTNYNRVSADYDRIRAFVARRPTQVVLDEAHRIKRGERGVHGRAVLDLAYAARRRDILTGTPAPQGAHDLVAPMRFLYPGQDQQILPAGAYYERNGRDEDVLQATGAAISRYFVRTPKARLDLPPTEIKVERLPMGAVQLAVYEALLGRYRGQFLLEQADRRHLDRLGRIMMYLLEAATNPMLLVAGSDADDEQGFAHPPLELQGDEPVLRLLERYREHETPTKYVRVREIVEDECRRGQKVIVWSTFVRNLKLLRDYLRPHQPALVHGGVPSEDAAVPGVVTRESELDRFRNDPNCTVLLANPAACGEGVSLHHWCHHAVYLDRTFNAGHYLQSQDRIHRIGLADDVLTRFTVLVSEGSIDEDVDGRLREKITALAKLMDDPGLVRVSLPEPDLHHDGAAIAEDDTAVIAALLKS
ncbi:DEAD/DEAH box helicase [Streptomyces sp. NPDC088910]|uniref:DEAD/DEAH box helicase n=1 Tax=Streptomyces sp. NPDC088910 TaxID=3365911 RepID=UPI0038216970